MREFVTEENESWEAIPEAAVVAHGKQGAVLAFRPAGGSDQEVLRTTITFNSMAAAHFALRTLGVRELRRRLSLARLAAGGV